jgi:hypothetical protein
MKSDRAGAESSRSIFLRATCAAIMQRTTRTVSPSVSIFGVRIAMRTTPSFRYSRALPHRVGEGFTFSGIVSREDERPQGQIVFLEPQFFCGFLYGIMKR